MDTITERLEAANRAYHEQGPQALAYILAAERLVAPLTRTTHRDCCDDDAAGDAELSEARELGRH